MILNSPKLLSYQSTLEEEYYLSFAELSEFHSFLLDGIHRVQTVLIAIEGIN